VSLKKLIEGRTFGMPRTVLGRGFRNNPVHRIPIRSIKGDVKRKRFSLSGPNRKIWQPAHSRITRPTSCALASNASWSKQSNS
jgi:hypothetical protein